ncbi:hypothetical protein BT69DRAFT_1297790 [Atractiella rhizophila]|nr:hypothetical protein BT69DRAFT_1297790 [Atractiella rhizophila]
MSRPMLPGQMVHPLPPIPQTAFNDRDRDARDRGFDRPQGGGRGRGGGDRGRRGRGPPPAREPFPMRERDRDRRDSVERRDRRSLSPPNRGMERERDGDRFRARDPAWSES